MKLSSGRPFQALGLLILLYACGGDAPNPVAVATPTPTPVPTPTPLGVGLACGVPAQRECGAEEGPTGVWGCCKKEPDAGNGLWDGYLWDVIQELQRTQPDLFRGQNIVDRERFMSAVARRTEEKYGLCVKVGGPGDEVGVKSSNGFNEQYDIYESNGRIRYPGYAVTCRPARF